MWQLLSFFTKDFFEIGIHSMQGLIATTKVIPIEKTYTYLKVVI